MKRAYPSHDFVSWELYDAAAVLYARKAEAEAQLVAAVLADPARGAPVAVQAGVTPAAFDAEDLRLIYCACDVGRGLPVDAVLGLAATALRRAGWWSPPGAIHRGSGCLWNDESLHLLAGRWFFCTEAVQRFAAKVLALDDRLRRADYHQGQLHVALCGGHDPDPKTLPSTRSRPTFRMLPNRGTAA
jgi:hypothetical protein